MKKKKEKADAEQACGKEETCALVTQSEIRARAAQQNTQTRAVEKLNEKPCQKKGSEQKDRQEQESSALVIQSALRRKEVNMPAYILKMAFQT